ncbi:unnamed protein product, partial [Rotaria socialis]
RPNIKRLLQIEFSSLLTNDEPFKLELLSLLADSISNIHTYESIFNGNIAKHDLILFIDRIMFMSDKEQVVDTLRLRFMGNQVPIVE